MVANLKRLIIGLLLTCPAWGVIANTGVGTVGFNTSGGAGVPSLASAAFVLTAGHLLVCNASWSSITITPTLTDTAGNTFTFVTSTNVGIINASSGQWYAKNTVANAADVVTLHYSSNIGFSWVACNQYSGADITAPFDTSAVGNGASAAAPATTGAFTTTVANEVLVAGIILNTADMSPTAGSGYTLEANTSDNRFWTQDKVVSGIQTGAFSTFTGNSDSYQMVVGTYKQQAAAATTVVHKTRSN